MRQASPNGSPDWPRPGSVDPVEIYNWRRLDARLTTSGQPTEPQLSEIAALGVACVINLGLHSHEKALRDEAGSLARLGLRYVPIPVDFKNPTEADFDAFCAAMKASLGGPLHVHCIANYRVSAFIYRYRRDVLGMAPTEIWPDVIAIWQPDEVWTNFIMPT